LKGLKWALRAFITFCYMLDYWLLYNIQRTWQDCCHNTHTFKIYINLEVFISWVWEKWSLVIENQKGVWHRVCLIWSCFETKKMSLNLLKKIWFNSNINAEVTRSRVWVVWSFVIENQKCVTSSMFNMKWI